MLDIETKSILISRKVVFHENIFPFSKLNLSSTIDNSPDFALFPDELLPKSMTDISSSSSIIPTIIQSPSFPDISMDSASSSRPQRTHRKPNYLKDYHCSLINSVEHIESSSTAHPIQKFLSYEKLSHFYKAFALSISVTSKPTSFKQVIAIPEWKAAMDSE